MAESEGAVGMGTLIEVGDQQSPETWSEFAEPKDIDGPELSQEYADATHMQSPSGQRERMPTVKSNSQVIFKTNKVAGNAVQDAQVTAANTSPVPLQHYRITYPDGDIITFYAYPGVKWTTPLTGMMEYNWTLSLKGAMTIS